MRQNNNDGGVDDDEKTEIDNHHHHRQKNEQTQDNKSLKEETIQSKANQQPHGTCNMHCIYNTNALHLKNKRKIHKHTHSTSIRVVAELKLHYLRYASHTVHVRKREK